MQTTSINKIGKRENLEDSIYSNKDGLFVVCDGVGGRLKGEVASSLVCESIASYFKNNISVIANEKDIQNAIAFAEKELTSHAEKHNSNGMATTVTLLQIYHSNAIIAHIGDSRVYHLRNNKILFETRDHSLVNDLVASGYITKEEAINHPKKNVINRAVQGTNDPSLVDIAPISNLQTGDYFILCTDGILETIDNKFIEENFSEDTDINDITLKIENLCSKSSNDNYSAIFVKI